MPPSHSPLPSASHEVKDIQVNLAFCIPAKKDSSRGTKKSAAPKGKVETKTKELSFTFESSDENYFLFLSKLLKVYMLIKSTSPSRSTLTTCWKVTVNFITLYSLLFLLSLRYCYYPSPLLSLPPIILIPLYGYHVFFCDSSWLLSTNSYFIYNGLMSNHSQLFTHQLRVSVYTYLYCLLLMATVVPLYNRLELLNISCLPTNWDSPLQ